LAEKNILAFFKSPEEADRALKQMESLSIVDSSVRRVDGYPGEGAAVNNPITGDIPSLGAMTLSGDFDDRNAGILAAASVSASGMSSGGPDNVVTGKDVLLTVVVQEQDHERALQIVREAGATV
jgi:hypothetical protein